MYSLSDTVPDNGDAEPGMSDDTRLSFLALPQTALHVLLSFLSVRDSLSASVLGKSLRDVLMPCFRNLRSPAFDAFEYCSLESIRWAMRYGVDLREFSLDLSTDQIVHNVPKVSEWKQMVAFGQVFFLLLCR